MKKNEYYETMRAERIVDCYGGDRCDEHIPQWRIQCDGDRGETIDTEPLILDCSKFPAGTLVQIKLPVCPECHMDVELCKEMGDCDFDWEEWAENIYS